MDCKTRVAIIGVIVLCLATTSGAEMRKELLVYKRNKRESTFDERTCAIFARFTAMLINFFNILQAPHDKDNVSVQVTGMVTGAVGLITDAIKSGSLSLDATPEEIEAYALSISKSITPSVMKTISSGVDV